MAAAALGGVDASTVGAGVGGDAVAATGGDPALAVGPGLIGGATEQPTTTANNGARIPDFAARRRMVVDRRRLGSVGSFVGAALIRR
jgi:hypothetical protein